MFETATPGRVETSEADPGEEDEDEVDDGKETNDEQEDIEGDDEEELDEEDGELDEDDEEEELNVGRYREQCQGLACEHALCGGKYERKRREESSSFPFVSFPFFLATQRACSQTTRTVILVMFDDSQNCFKI